MRADIKSPRHIFLLLSLALYVAACLTTALIFTPATNPKANDDDDDDE